ncbi:hypothetical protein OKW43_001231 [Paraburkholderia sp. WC7.3g]|uniref:Uncharacterized protein n=1 Tax=Paraburkholderia podalyriae TaxID=1938811 RepID=A0ABR7PQ35_9BURK|nr:hypothetical protein [Paraburkholderia podalyriae]MBC8748360.1 hypothetical protein [Paraburkholderia podalyriae]
MPIKVAITVDKLNAFLAIREEYGSLQREHEEVRSALCLVTVERDFAEERLLSTDANCSAQKSEAGLRNSLACSTKPNCSAWD